MVSFTVRVEGLEELKDSFDSLPDDLGPTITRALTIAASEAVEQIQSSISDSYPPPSIPFTPPHVRTGALRRSARIERIEPGIVTIAVGGPGSIVPYAAWLEFGTSKMEPRPFVEPVIERIKPGITSIITEEVNKDLEQAIA